MVMIQLKKDVSVAVGDDTFETIKAGQFVNYGCKKIDNHWHHWFHAYVKKLQRTVEFKMINAQDGPPEWL